MGNAVYLIRKQDAPTYEEDGNGGSPCSIKYQDIK